MNLSVTKANRLLLDLTNKYQNIRYGNLTIPTPYFMNTAEMIYKTAMKDTGIDKNHIDKTIQMIKKGETPLGSAGGKGTPEQIESDLERMMDYINSKGFYPESVDMIRNWMKEMHIGLDCSGYVYNILAIIEKDQNVSILKDLAWADPSSIKPSHAGVYVFDSPKLQHITEYGSIQPLDILIMKDHTHVGIVAENKGQMLISDCSMPKDGITFSNISIQNNKIEVKNFDYWTSSFKKNEVIIKRIKFK